jgi:hypothetical protein
MLLLPLLGSIFDPLGAKNLPCCENEVAPSSDCSAFPLINTEGSDDADKGNPNTALELSKLPLIGMEGKFDITMLPIPLPGSPWVLDSGFTGL